MKLTRLQELGTITEASIVSEDGFFATEGQHYDDSSTFTDEFYGVCADVQKMKKILKSPKWMNWMKSTDQNFDVEVVPLARDAISALNALDRALAEISHEFDKADGIADGEFTPPEDIEED